MIITIIEKQGDSNSNSTLASVVFPSPALNSPRPSLSCLVPCPVPRPAPCPLPCPVPVPFPSFLFFPSSLFLSYPSLPVPSLSFPSPPSACIPSLQSRLFLPCSRHLSVLEQLGKTLQSTQGEMFST